MRAIVVRQLGAPSVLALDSLPTPVPGEGEVLVRLHACGVNFADTERRRGLYATPELPWVPGHEGAGVVEAIGPRVDPALLGRRVSFWSPRSTGTYAELALAPVDALFTFERELEFAQMAALPLQGLTAAGVLALAGPVRGKTVAVHAAAGGVGQILVQLARAAGARVLGLSSTPSKLAVIAALGAEPVSSAGAWAAKTAPVDVIFDSVGRVTAEESLRALAPGGQLLFFGEASGPPAAIEVDRLYARSLRVGAFMIDVARDPEWARTARLALAEGLGGGALRLSPPKIYPLRDAAEAHRALEARETVGKIVLDPFGA